MKKITLILGIAIGLSSCNSLKNAGTTSVSNAATLLGSLSSNATVQQLASLFSLLDTDGDSLINTSEAIGTVSENFSSLDLDNSSSLNLSEFKNLTSFLD